MWGTKPGAPPGGGDVGGGNGTCNFAGNPGAGLAPAAVPCYIPSLNAWYAGSGCYYGEAIQPPATDPVWAGHAPGEGAIYMRYCFVAPGDPVGVEIVWLANPPAGNPVALAQQALATITLTGARIGIAPNPNGAGLVGLPVWLWTDPQLWNVPASASASANGLTVTISARAAKVAFDLGDGSVPEICTGPGTPYQASFGASSSPDCGHTYRAPSRNLPGGQYTITATTTYRVDWVTGGGAKGVIFTSRVSQSTARIEELQVVVR